MMKKLISVFLVLAMCTAASAVTVSLVDITPGAAGSAEAPLRASDEIIIEVQADGVLLGLDAIFTLEGPGTIIGAVSTADAAAYGWDPSLSFDPTINGVDAEIGLGNFSGSSVGVVGYILVHCDDIGAVVVTMTPGQAFGGSADGEFNVPAFGAGTVTIHQIPEPATICLLGLGGLALLRRRK